MVGRGSWIGSSLHLKKSFWGFKGAFGANMDRSDGEDSPLLENLGEDGKRSPSIMFPSPNKHMQGWRALSIYSISTLSKHLHRTLLLLKMHMPF
jgi:hypothetical protein